MRSWTPKPFRISSSASKLHLAPPKRTLRIKRYTAQGTAFNVACHRYIPLRLVEEVQDFPPSRLPVVRGTTVGQEQQPRDLIRKIVIGADRDDNIAAYEQRHQRFLKIFKGATDSGGIATIEEPGINKVEEAPSIQQNRNQSATEGAKASNEKQDDDPQIRRRRSFLAQTEPLNAIGRSSTTEGQSLGNPGKTKISNNVFFDAQFPAGPKPTPFIRPDLWSQTSMRNVKARERGLGSESAIVEEVRTSGSNGSQSPFKRLSLGSAGEKDSHPDNNKDSHVNVKKHDDGSKLPWVINKDNKGTGRPPRLFSRAVQRSESESVAVLDASGMTSKGEKPFKRVRKPKASLFEALFPEEASKYSTSEKDLKLQYPDIPKLSLPVLDEDESFGNEYMRGRIAGTEKAKAASQDAFQSWNPSILVLQVASPSLIDSDFRRIAPKGQHISEWTGPGDYFKVIPGRDPQTLKPESHYFLVFPNPAYARTYHHHVRHLHDLAHTHTPTSIASPMPPPNGMLLQGEDVHTLIQDYTLCPPSQQCSLFHLSWPLSADLRRLLRHHGYPELTQPVDKTGRAVLFWVEGFVPLWSQVEQFLMRDGRQRGMAWALLNGKDSIQQIDPSGSRDLKNEDDPDADEPAAMESEEAPDDGNKIRDYARRTRIRWTIAFEDENEARRFVRRWHLRPFQEASEEPVKRGDHAPLVHAEFLW